MIRFDVPFEHGRLLNQVLLDNFDGVLILKQCQLINLVLLPHLSESLLDFPVVISAGVHLCLQIAYLFEHLFSIVVDLVVQFVELVYFLVSEIPDIGHEFVAWEVPVE